MAESYIFQKSLPLITQLDLDVAFEKGFKLGKNDLTPFPISDAPKNFCFIGFYFSEFYPSAPAAIGEARWIENQRRYVFLDKDIQVLPTHYWLLPKLPTPTP